MEETGLSSADASHLLAVHGENRLPEKKPDSYALIFVRQFQSPLIYLLLIASLSVFALGDVVDGVIILAVLVFNAIVGAIQEGKAQNTLRALASFVDTSATVVRDGRESIVSDRVVVPGDIIVLQEGEKVPADAEILDSFGLLVDEAALTGESLPIPKAVHSIDAPSVVYKGTHVVSGHGRARVTSTGAKTRIGSIATSIAGIDTETPLKADIRILSRNIIWVVVVVSILLFSIGTLTGKSHVEMFSTIVSLAVSIVPEGLPIVITLILAGGVWRMSKKNTLIKKLHAVEALGEARILAVDKTGTLTKNEVVVERVLVEGTHYSVSGNGYDPHGDVVRDGISIDAASHPELLRMGIIATLAANVRIQYDEETTTWRVGGDPTDAALQVFGQKIGFHRDALVHEYPLIAELPFRFETRFHALLVESAQGPWLLAVGAPEVILARTRGDSAHVLLSAEELSAQGYRVIACASKYVKQRTLSTESDVTDLEFVGFIAMRDALRAEVPAAVAAATAAGLKVVMITGDHRTTAAAIAREAGIYQEGSSVLTGTDIDALTEEGLREALQSVSVFARVTPEHKLRIISAYRARGDVVAMTGDGVNDAPSLVAADLGVAMGKVGTEVAKESADIILLDDNIGSIVAAVEEGRSIYRTVKKVIVYLFSTSLGELFVITGALIVSLPVPLLPAQIIWLNFVTDGFLTVALAMEPKDRDLLKSWRRTHTRSLIDRSGLIRMSLMALAMVGGTLYLFISAYEADLAHALTLSLTVLAVFQWFNAWNCRSSNESVFRMNPFSNLWLVGATGIVIGLQLLAVYHPWFQSVLHTVPLSLSDWGIALAVAASIIVIDEARKVVVRFYGRSRILGESEV